MAQATFHFNDDLSYFVKRKRRKPSFTYSFDWRSSIKDMIESFGVPHSEIELLVVNGVSVGFEHIVEDGDDVQVYARFETINHIDKVRLRPPTPQPPRFVLDIHLGRLAAYLRMLGFDSKWRNDYPDDELAQVAHDENRVLLTRDVGCLKRSLVIYGYFVRSTDPTKRVMEVIERFDLAPLVTLFKHCMKCNGLVHQVAKESILDKLPHDTALYFDEFHCCEDCARIFWKGSHYDQMQTLINQVLGEDAP